MLLTILANDKSNPNTLPSSVGLNHIMAKTFWATCKLSLIRLEEKERKGAMVNFVAAANYYI